MDYGTRKVYKTTIHKEGERNKSQKKFDEAPQDVTAKIIGDFGRWQLRISIMMTLLKLPTAWFQLDIVFLAPNQEFWCKKPDSFSKYSDDEWREMCCPKIEEHPCLIYDYDILLTVPELDKHMIPMIVCTNFVYDRSTFTRTIVSDWNLVCSHHWLVHLSQCVLMWGVLVGGVFFGVLADKYGRKLPLMIAILTQTVTSFTSSLMPWFSGFLINRFILALASGGLGVISFVLCMEVVSGKWRTTIPILYHLPFGIGNAVMAWLAYLFRDWRKLELCMSMLSSLYLCYWFVIPESPRWLLAKGRTEQALRVLKQAALINNRDIDTEKIRRLLPKEVKVVKKEPGFLAFMRSKNMRTKTFLLSANWFCTGLAFYAFSQNLGSIGDNIFLTVFMCGIISTPGSLVCVLIINKLGRKKTVATFQLITALCFFFILIIPKDAYVNDWPRFFFAGVGFAGMAGSVPALYLFSGEIFPTLGRNVGVGGVNTFARIGSMMAPALVNLENIKEGLPLLLLAIMSLLQILMVLPLPETKNCPLPDTLEQAENINRQFCEDYGLKKKKSRRNRKYEGHYRCRQLYLNPVMRPIYERRQRIVETVDRWTNTKGPGAKINRYIQAEIKECSSV